MGAVLTGLLAASAVAYTLAGVSHVFYIFRRHWAALARWSSRAAWVIHTVGLVLLVMHAGRPPIYTVFEFAFFFTWLMMTSYTVMEYVRDDQSAGAFLVPVLAAVQVLSVGLPKPAPEHELLAEFPASLIGWHVGVTMLGYAFFFASFVAGALYLLQERNLRLKRWGPLYYRLPSLETLDIWGGRFVSIGFPLLTLGMGTGLFFAHVTWETFWQADPKVIFTVFVWVVYGTYLILRKGWGWGGRKASWWAVAGAAFLLINYFVMNLLSRTHRFGV